VLDRSLQESYGVFLSVLINGLFCKTFVYTCSLFNLRPNCLYYLFDNPKITSPTLRHLIFDMNFPQFFQPKDAPGFVLFPTWPKLPKKTTGPSTCVDLRLGWHALPNKLDASLGLVGISTMFLFPRKNEWCYAMLCWITKAFRIMFLFFCLTFAKLFGPNGAADNSHLF